MMVDGGDGDVMVVVGPESFDHFRHVPTGGSTDIL